MLTPIEKKFPIPEGHIRVDVTWIVPGEDGVHVISSMVESAGNTDPTTLVWSAQIAYRQLVERVANADRATADPKLTAFLLARKARSGK